MEYFPIAINLHGKACLVVGGGNVALRKTTNLVKFGAIVTVISPKVVDGFAPLGVKIELREFETKDIENVFLVVTATDSPTLNQSILSLCNSRGTLCNSATNCTDNGYIFSSVAMCENITVGITTNGESPYISKLIKEDIQGEVLPKYVEALKVSKQYRKTVSKEEIKSLIDSTLHKK